MIRKKQKDFYDQDAFWGEDGDPSQASSCHPSALYPVISISCHAGQVLINFDFKSEKDIMNIEVSRLEKKGGGTSEDSNLSVSKN